ncbi:hypothetical protein Vid5_gp69 [Pantoea phage vB_PagS_Vid5]|uniref:Uncharacterized protein n=1 Tax=Pantoea phage vB_PagS_Vid5 TaxID=2099652 RepID=A0A2P1CKX3_9CAUD|nr:hypothetical protein FDJ45_gp086 [Pantoea phage vB_PagS_Vid5]AVJ51824.1 hypothetical protein Vid5_gp69 [Pantoea phage vB_PagS_Vid5]
MAVSTGCAGVLAGNLLPVAVRTATRPSPSTLSLSIHNINYIQLQEPLQYLTLNIRGNVAAYV